jgi:putative transposase
MDQELLLRNEYLVAENRILKTQLPRCLRLSDAERAKLSEIGHRPGRNALDDVATSCSTALSIGGGPGWTCQ